MAMPKTPALTTDCAIYDPEGRVLLIRRGHDPYAGGYALPGGFVEIGETMEAACRREVREETGIEIGELRLVGVYSDPSRDPRGHTVSVAYAAMLPRALSPQSGSDAASAEWIADWRSLALAFDHAQILEDAETLLAASRLGGRRRKERGLVPNQRRAARLKALSSE
jgi:8-oxo-dGTP diphosphatase